jgi:hypothetical protein
MTRQFKKWGAQQTDADRSPFRQTHLVDSAGEYEARIETSQRKTRT